MSQSEEDVEIIDRATNNIVKAILHIGLDELEVIDVATDWSPERLRAHRRLRERGDRLPEHVHWDWAMKAYKRNQILDHKILGIKAEGKMQGLMSVRLSGNARLDPDIGKPLVYVDFVETAPWNTKEFTTSPTYKGVGIRLMQAATRLSIDEGFYGRVGLHSLPQSKSFYTNACEMQSLGIDANHLEYFELTAAKAAEFLKK